MNCLLQSSTVMVMHSTYNKIIIRLFQYRYFKKPKEHISTLSKEWFTDFFKYLWETGYYVVNTVAFDPLSPDYGKIFEGKNLEPDYDSNQLHSLRDITRTVLNKILGRWFAYCQN